MSPRLLLIEDDDWLAESYARVLGRDYTVDIAPSSQAAIALVDDHRYAIIVADVMLEHGLVIDLLHELQAYDDTAELPIVLCTTLAQRIHLKDVEAYGVVAVLDKTTLTPRLLRDIVGRVNGKM